LTNYLAGRFKPVEQDESQASYCKVIHKKDGYIEWQEHARSIRDKIRAYNMWPVAYCYLRGRQLRIFNARVVDTPPFIPEDAVPGQVVSAEKELGIVVKTGNGYLGITDLQMENRRRMDYLEFLNGHRDLEGSVLGAP
jgi:methionyl-tRNA formyltransferase